MVWKNFASNTTIKSGFGLNTDSNKSKVGIEMLLVAVAGVDICKCAIFHFLYIHICKWMAIASRIRAREKWYCAIANRWLMLNLDGLCILIHFCAQIYRIEFGWMWLDFRKRQTACEKLSFTMRSRWFALCIMRMYCNWNVLCANARSSRRRCYIDFKLVLSLSQAHSNAENYSRSLKLRNVSHVIRFTCIDIHFSLKTHPTPKKNWPTSVLIIDDLCRRSRCYCHKIVIQSFLVQLLSQNSNTVFITLMHRWWTILISRIPNHFFSRKFLFIYYFHKCFANLICQNF